MASPFDNWSYEDAKLAAQLSSEQAQDLDSYRKFVAGDGFQDWKGWAGPTPPIGMPADEATKMSSDIERGFVSYNALGEATGRHVNGVLGRNVKYSVVTKRTLAQDEQPEAEEQARINEAKGLLDEWVKLRKLNQEFDKVAEEMLITGVAHLRPFVAPGQVDANGIVPQADLATSLGRVYFNYPLRGEAVVWTDPRTQQQCSIYLYRQVTSSRPSEVAKAQGDERAELTYLDGDETIVRIVGTDGTVIPENQVDFSYALGKRLLMAEMARRPLLNPQVVSLQKLLNLALTMMQLNVIIGGYLERVALNGQFNGRYEDVVDANGVTRSKFVYDPMPIGPLAMTTVTGIVVTNDDGNKSITTPNMLWRDPVSVGTFTDTVREAKELILSACNQLHYSMSSDGNVGAESRITAMAAYLIDLLQTKQQVDAGWAWLLETALSLAAVLAGVPGRFDDLRVSAECSVDPGPISVEMIRVVIELWAVGKLTLKTGLGWIGIEDVDGEIAALDAEKAKADAAGDAGETAKIIAAAMKLLETEPT